jgi:hypothetical protein
MSSEFRNEIESLIASSSIDKAGELMREFVSDDWEDHVIPRKIAVPNGYHSPRHWWAQSALKAYSHYQVKNNPSLFEQSAANARAMPLSHEEWEREYNMFAATTSQLLASDAPTYFVTDALITALERTDVEDSIPMEELKFPHEGMMFVLPSSRRYAEVQGVGYKSSYIVMLTIARVDHERYGKSYIVTMLDHNGVTAYAHYPVEGTYGNQMAKYGSDFIIDDPIKMYLEEMAEDVKVEQIDADRRQVNTVTRLAWKLLCAMNAANETVVTGGGIMREAREKKGKTRPALWSPIMLDLSERLSSDGDESQGVGVRLHWRRGHFRRQVCGVGRTERRLLWIKPHKVGSL